MQLTSHPSQRYSIFALFARRTTTRIKLSAYKEMIEQSGLPSIGTTVVNSRKQTASPRQVLRSLKKTLGFGAMTATEETAFLSQMKEILGKNALWPLTWRTSLISGLDKNRVTKGR